MSPASDLAQATGIPPHVCLRSSPPNAAPAPAGVRGYWRAGDPPGRRQFAYLGEFSCESGWRVPLQMAYQTWGRLNRAGDNAILVLHALSGDSHVRGPAGPGQPTPGWWPDMVGPGLPLDTNRFFVVAPNAFGGCQGSTGPSSLAPDGVPWGARFGPLTIRDQVGAEAALAEYLGIRSWALVVGGSAGGMRALEWAVTFPDQVRGLAVLAVSAFTTADQMAWTVPQVAAITNDPHFHGGDYYHCHTGPGSGLQVAWQVATVTHRSGGHFNERFGRNLTGQLTGDNHEKKCVVDQLRQYAVSSYVQHQGVKITRRFDANTLISMIQAVNSHDVGRGRGGVAAALSRVAARTVVVAFDSDRLYQRELHEQLADGISGSGPVQLVRSAWGHDGFLTETEAFAASLTAAVYP